MATKINNKGFKKPKNRKNKVVLVFDEDKRRDFLTGFHKRKLQRKKEAKEKLELELNAERKRLKKEARESYKKLVVSHRPIPELEQLLTEEFEDDNVTVKVTELSTSKIAERNNWIGENKPYYEPEQESENENEEEISNDNKDIPGMELKRKPIVKEEKQKIEFKTKKELKKVLKKQATKNVQNSKAFQMKNKVERQKNKKKSLKQKKERIRMTAKQNKNKKRRG